VAKQNAKKTMVCHSERSEESLFDLNGFKTKTREIPAFARNDTQRGGAETKSVPIVPRRAWSPGITFLRAAQGMATRVVQSTFSAACKPTTHEDSNFSHGC
jgi:hypothetical protein